MLRTVDGHSLTPGKLSPRWHRNYPSFLLAAFNEKLVHTYAFDNFRSEQYLEAVAVAAAAELSTRKRESALSPSRRLIHLNCFLYISVYGGMLLTIEGDACSATTERSPLVYILDQLLDLIKPKIFTQAKLGVRMTSYSWGSLCSVTGLWDSILLWASP